MVRKSLGTIGIFWLAVLSLNLECERDESRPLIEISHSAGRPTLTFEQSINGLEKGPMPTNSVTLSHSAYYSHALLGSIPNVRLDTWSIITKPPDLSAVWR